MLRAIDVQITPLPFESERSQADRILRLSEDQVSITIIGKTISNLIEYILNDFVSPSGPESIFSLFLSGDPAITSRLSDLAELCVKLQDLYKLERRCLASAAARTMVRGIENLRRKKLEIAFRLLGKREKEEGVKLPSLPFCNVGTAKEGVALPVAKGKAPHIPPSMSTKGSAPSPPNLPLNATVKVDSGLNVQSTAKGCAPSIPTTMKACPVINGAGLSVQSTAKGGRPPSLPGKSSTPSLPTVQTTTGVGPPDLPGKGSAPALPTMGVSVQPMGKGCAPSLPGKSSSAALPTVQTTTGVSGKGSAPRMPSGKAPSIPPPSALPVTSKSIPSVKPASEITIFEAPKLLEEDVETRKIHWQSLPGPRFRESVFDLQLLQRKEEFESAIFNMELVRNHFVKSRGVGSPTASPCRTAPTAASSPISTSMNLTIPSVLETRRIQQIEIFLNGRKGLSASDVVTILKSGGDEQSVDLLEAVLPLFPSSEERALLQGQAGKGPLGKADAFLIDMMRIPDFQIAANYVIVLHTAEPVASETLEYFDELIDFIVALRTSSAIPKLLKIIGSMVVYLWNGKKANLNGFSLDVIPQLKKVHSYKDKDFTLMNCLVDAIPSSDLDEVLRALNTVESLLEFDFADTLARSEEVERSVRSMKPAERLDGKYFPVLVRRLADFKEEMEEKYFKGLSEKRATVREKSVEILKYFAESEKKNFNEFLASLNGLRVDLLSARAQNDKRRSNKRVD